MAANPLKCCVFGANLVSNLSDQIITMMSSLDFIDNNYPMLTAWGLRDEDVLVHSLGCSVWNALGQTLGLMALTECPAPSTHGADIRSDSTWFDREQRKPKVLIEFERFDGTAKGQQKLDEKTRNLLEASMRWNNSPAILILSVWSKGVVSAPDTEKLLAYCHAGFRSSAGVQVLPAQGLIVLFSRFIFDVEKTGYLLLKQTRCSRLA